MATQLDEKFRRAKRGIRAQVAEISIGEHKTYLVLLTTSMNVSGQAVVPLMQRLNTDPGQLLVVHDDIDLPFAKLRVQFGRGAGGHNGVESIRGSLGTQEFWRLKLGVGRPPGSTDPASFVLKRFSKSEQVGVEDMMARAIDVLETYIRSGPAEARQQAGDEAGPR